MPVYQCFTPLALSPELKGAIAKEFTRIHREFTGAPEPFVNIVFLDLPHGSHYLGGAVRENGTLINAIVRAGRTLETRQALLKSLSAAWSRLTGQPERKLVIRVEEATLRPSWKRASSCRVLARKPLGWRKTRRRLASSPRSLRKPNG